MNSVSIASISALHVSIVYILAIPGNISALQGYVFIIKAPQPIPTTLSPLPSYQPYLMALLWFSQI